MTIAVDFALHILGSSIVAILVVGMHDVDDDDEIILLMIVY